MIVDVKIRFDLRALLTVHITGHDYYRTCNYMYIEGLGEGRGEEL